MNKKFIRILIGLALLIVGVILTVSLDREVSSYYLGWTVGYVVYKYFNPHEKLDNNDYYIESGKAIEHLMKSHIGIIGEVEDKHDTGFAFNTLGKRFKSIDEMIEWYKEDRKAK